MIKSPGVPPLRESDDTGGAGATTGTGERCGTEPGVRLGLGTLGGLALGLLGTLLRGGASAMTLGHVIVFNWIFKVMMEVLFTPLTYLIVGFLKKAEQEDWYDRDTNFTPFSLSA